MKTVTLAQAQAKLPALVKRAQRGEDIGIVAGSRVVALRLVPVISADIQPLTPEYAAQEYGVTPEELARFKDRQSKANATARRQGRITRYEGRFDPRTFD